MFQSFSIFKINLFRKCVVTFLALYKEIDKALFKNNGKYIKKSSNIEHLTIVMNSVVTVDRVNISRQRLSRN